MIFNQLAKCQMELITGIRQFWETEVTIEYCNSKIVNRELTAPNLKYRFGLRASVRTVQKYMNILGIFYTIIIFLSQF